jgi:hypothetical protein
VIVVSLTGGLGNQLFCYAVGRKLALSNKTSLHLYVGNYLKYWSRKYQLGSFNIEAGLLYRGKNIQDMNRIKDIRSELNQLVVQNADNLFLEGYWQSPIYFQNIREQLMLDLSLKKSLDKKNLSILKQITTTNSVCVHVRRGDYASLRKTHRKYGNICTEDHYVKAVRYLNNHLENPTYFVFSDDPGWIKKNFYLPVDFILVEENKGKKTSKFGDNFFLRNSMVFLKYFWKDRSFADFELMKNCKNFIIANSTFSWWAAWLSENQDKIICCPPKWTNIDTAEEKSFYNLLIPSSWIKIE